MRILGNLYELVFRIYIKLYPRLNKIRGATRLRRFLETCAESSNRNIVEFEIFETRMAAPSNTDQAFEFYFGNRNYQELEFLKYMIRNIEEEDVFADVGASFGLFSSVIANRTEAKVYSFEPLKLNTCFQELNKELYGYDFSVNQVAVSKDSGKVELNVSSHSHGGNDISEVTNTQEKYTVNAVSLDTELENLDFVKIDVEGAELDVLKGMSGLLEKSEPIILIDIHDEKQLSKFNCTKIDIMNFLSQYGYQVPNDLSKGNNHLILEHSEN